MVTINHSGVPDDLPTLHLAHMNTPYTAPSLPIHVATLNVRYDGLRHNPIPIPPSGAVDPQPRKPWESPYREQPWAIRRSRMVDALLSVGELDLIGFQEVYVSQLKDLEALLGPNWGCVGVGRDDGKEAGEYSPLFFRKNRFDLVKWKTIWLSPTPQIPGSVGWDASQTRIATILTLRDRGNHGLVHAINTHYDDQGETARAESSLLIRSAIREWVDDVERAELSQFSTGKAPVILFGDFNSPATEGGYRNVTSPLPLKNGKASFSFLDAYYNTVVRNPSNPSAQWRPYGPKKTYTGFSAPGHERTTRIDFVMLALKEKEGLNPTGETTEMGETQSKAEVGRGGWTFTQYTVIDNWIEEGDAGGFEGRWSDHRAVRVTIEKK